MQIGVFLPIGNNGWLVFTVMKELWATERLPADAIRKNPCHQRGAERGRHAVRGGARGLQFSVRRRHRSTDPCRRKCRAPGDRQQGRRDACGALVLTMIIGDETDAAALVKWEHHKTGTDHEAIAWRDSQFADDPTSDPLAGPNKRRTLGTQGLPTHGSVLIGSHASVTSMLDELASVPGVQGVMLTFDDFISGMEQFGTRIQPLMRSRAEQNLVAGAEPCRLRQLLRPRPACVEWDAAVRDAASGPGADGLYSAQDLTS